MSCEQKYGAQDESEQEDEFLECAGVYQECTGVYRSVSALVRALVLVLTLVAVLIDRRPQGRFLTNFLGRFSRQHCYISDELCR